MAHAVLVTPVYGDAGDAGAVGVGQVAFAAGEEGAPVAGYFGEEEACCGGLGVGHAEVDAFSEAGLEVGEPAGIEVCGGWCGGSLGMVGCGGELAEAEWCCWEDLSSGA